MVEVKVPPIGESITEVVVGAYTKKIGEAFALEETVVELESDKATVEVPAPSAGVLSQGLKQEGETAAIGEVIALIDETAAPQAGANGSAPVSAQPAAASRQGQPSAPQAQPQGAAPTPQGGQQVLMPSAQRIAQSNNIPPAQIAGSGPGGRILKEDALRAVEQRSGAPAQQAAQAAAPPRPVQATHAEPGALEEIMPMSPIRKRIAERLVQSKQEMALLTTFNEIDMSNVMALRKQYQESFTAKYGIKLGFMSFFIKAAIDALKLIPQVNGEIRGNQIVYKNHYDIGIAVGGGKGLVVPVIRNADHLGFGELEQVIADLGSRAAANKIELSELEGGTFTVSNGGIYGSLMSTPIVNPPQSAILGLHAIKDRPVAVDGQVVIRPMMYVALTYDHRLIDGRESVTFLKRIKECIEDPSRMILEV
jgi:2-oxoglutarate dehydrogenase E2 component (dihydrolipoamide succinyltransferase)